MSRGFIFICMCTNGNVIIVISNAGIMDDVSYKHTSV